MWIVEIEVVFCSSRCSVQVRYFVSICCVCLTLSRPGLQLLKAATAQVIPIVFSEKYTWSCIVYNELWEVGLVHDYSPFSWKQERSYWNLNAAHRSEYWTALYGVVTTWIYQDLRCFHFLQMGIVTLSSGVPWPRCEFRRSLDHMSSGVSTTKYIPGAMKRDSTRRWLKCLQYWRGLEDVFLTEDKQLFKVF